MKNIKDLRNRLIGQLKKFDKSNKDDANVRELVAESLCASSIIRTCRMELDYKKYRNDDSEIDFLNTSAGRKMISGKKGKNVSTKNTSR